MEAAERKPNEKHLYREEKYAAKYEINMLRCICCGLCEEACPKEAMTDFAVEWKEQVRCKPIPEVSHRREAFNIILSMPTGTPPDAVREAARDFLKEEFGGKHRYCFTLHTDTDKPHVHVCVLAAPITKAKRLNPRKADLQRWREGFAEQLRNLGIDANATPRRTRGATQNSLRQSGHHTRKRQAIQFTRIENQVDWPRVYKGALDAWQRLARTLKGSPNTADRETADLIDQFVTPHGPDIPKKR